jgi:NAD(P)-dependent dehydrogenase (short-subunit alcohol dehydrogenase family)
MTTAIVLNANSTPGQAACNAVEARKYNLIKVCRNNDNNPPDMYSLDTTSTNEVKILAKDLDNKGANIDYLITCPAPETNSIGAVSYYPFEDINDSEWKDNIEQNLRAPALFCHVFGGIMQARSKGKIIQLVSNVAIDPHDQRHFADVHKNERPGYPSAAYTCAMAGVMALTRHLAAVYQNSGVLINNIVYGPMQESIPKILAKSYLHRVPMGRNLTIKDLSNAIDLLLNPGSNYITGQNIKVDGGVSIW